MVWGATIAQGQWPTSVNLSQELPRVVGLVTSISERKETKSRVTRPVSQTTASECLSLSYQHPMGRGLHGVNSLGPTGHRAHPEWS